MSRVTKEKEKETGQREERKTNTPDLIYKIHISMIQQWEYSIKS